MREPGTSLVVQWLRPTSKAEGTGLIPGQGAKVPCAFQPKNQNIKKKKNNIVTNSINTLKMVHIKKKNFKEIKIKCWKHIKHVILCAKFLQSCLTV